MLSRHACALLALGGMTAAPRLAAASETDPWLGRDKALHFGVCAALGAGGWTLGALVDDEPATRLALGLGLPLAAGAAKELYDLSGRGDPSWRDLTWDGIGAVAGVLSGWA